jgi:hypothetical protein
MRNYCVKLGSEYILYKVYKELSLCLTHKVDFFIVYVTTLSVIPDDTVSNDKTVVNNVLFPSEITQQELNAPKLDPIFCEHKSL